MREHSSCLTSAFAALVSYSIQDLYLQIGTQVKEDLKTVALGTSKINYLDPRISVSWCKRNEVRARRMCSSANTSSDCGQYCSKSSIRLWALQFVNDVN